MRRMSTVLFVVVALFFVVGANACGEASEASLAGEDQSPQAIIAATMAASETMTEATGSFDLALTFDADTSDMPDEAKAFVDEPMNVSGTFGYADEPRAADFTIKLSLAGETMDVGMRLIENRLWVSMRDQWYEAPAEMEQTMAQSFDQQTQLDELKTLLGELGVDPVTWFKDLRLVGEESLDGTDAYHLAGSPDMAKMLADVVGLLQSEEFMSIVDPSGTMTQSMGAGELAPSPEDLQEMQTQLSQMLKDFAVDLWIGKEDSMMRKATADLSIVPPAGEDTGGLNGIAVKTSISLADPDETLKVEPPASALPYSDLEKAMQENPEMFFGPLMGLMGGLGGYGTGGEGSY